MYESGGGEFGDGDLLRALKDDQESPSYGAIFVMCRRMGIVEDEQRTINRDDAWAYFYELMGKYSGTVTSEQLHESLASYLLPGEIKEHLNHIESNLRRTA